MIKTFLPLLSKDMIRPLLFILALLPVVSKAQTGNGMNDALNAGTFNTCSTTYTDSRNNYYYNGTNYSNNYDDVGTQYNGQPSPDVWYKFEIGEDCPSLLISVTGALSKYVHLVDSAGNQIDSSWGNSNYPASFYYDGVNWDYSWVDGPAGTYYLVVEGYGNETGDYQLSISTGSCQEE